MRSNNFDADVPRDEDMSIPKLKDGLSPEEAVEYLRPYGPRNMNINHFHELETKFQEYVKNDPHAFSELAPQIMGLNMHLILVFLAGIEDAINQKRIDWKAALSLYEQIVKLVKQSRLDRVQIHHSIARTIDDRMKECSIDFALKDQVWKILSRLVIIENDDPYEEQTYPVSNKPSYYISNWASDRAAFNSILSYALWCERNTEGEKILADEVRDLISDYLDHIIPATVSSQAILAYHLPDLYRLDKDWIRPRLDQLFTRDDESLSKSAWDGYVINDVERNIFADLVDKYDIHIRKLRYPRPYNGEFWEVDECVIEHVTRAYLFKFDKAEELFNKMILHSHDMAVHHCAECISQILREQKDSPDISIDVDVFRKLWKNVRFTRYAEFNYWLGSMNLDKKEELEFLYTMLEKSEDDIYVLLQVKKLEPYAELYPELTIKCLSQLLQKKNGCGDYYPLEELEGLFRILLDDDKTNKEATRMIQNLQNHSFAEYNKLSELIE